MNNLEADHDARYIGSSKRLVPLRFRLCIMVDVFVRRHPRVTRMSARQVFQIHIRRRSDREYPDIYVLQVRRSSIFHH